MYKIEKKIAKITEGQYSELDIKKLLENVSPSLFLVKSFGNPIQNDLKLLYEGKISEGYYKTYPLNNVVNYIDKMLGELGTIHAVYRGSHAIIDVNVYDNEETVEQLKKAFNLCGYYNSGADETRNGMKRMYFEPRYSDNVDEYVKEVGSLYHVTRTKHVKKIMQNGLSPRNANQYFNYPPRVYLLMGDASSDLLISVINMLNNGTVSDGDNAVDLNTDKTENEWSILSIDVNKISDDIKFYADTTFFNEYSVYTTDNIPPKAIKVIKNIKIENYK